MYESILSLQLLETNCVKQSGSTWGSGLYVLEHISDLHTIKLYDLVA